MQAPAGRTDEDRARAQALVVDGVRLREAGDLPASQAALEEALRLDASLANAHIEWAITAEGIGAATALVGAHHQLGARLAPENARAQLLAASWGARHGDASVALEFFERALAVDPSNVEARARKADLLFARGDLEGAIASYRLALSVDAASVPSWTGLAEAAEKADRREIAEEAHLALIELSPDATIYRTRLVAFYKRTGQAAKALAAQRELERRDPRDPRRLRKLRR